MLEKNDVGRKTCTIIERNTFGTCSRFVTRMRLSLPRISFRYMLQERRCIPKDLCYTPSIAHNWLSVDHIWSLVGHAHRKRCDTAFAKWIIMQVFVAIKHIPEGSSSQAIGACEAFFVDGIQVFGQSRLICRKFLGGEQWERLWEVVPPSFFWLDSLSRWPICDQCGDLCDQRNL